MSEASSVDLRTLFFKYAADRENEVRQANRRVVYYTRAETALKILTNREIWLRSAGFMNDVSEIHHGMRCMEFALQTGGERRLSQILDLAHPKLAQSSLADLRRAAGLMFSATYICCVSEHLGDREDQFGRLSMWRAYGGSTGIAMVFNTRAMFSESNALGTYTGPVLYEDQRGFAREFSAVLDRLEAHIDFIAAQPKKTIEYFLREMLHFAVLSTKHPAFAEELEWRVIHAPYHESNERMKAVTETIRGVPQLVFKLPLEDVPNEGLTGLKTVDSLDRIIIGPCNHPIETSFVFHEALKAQGIENPYEKIVVSGVPLRVTD